MIDKKVGIIGVGSVGASYAYAMLNQGTASEIVLVDRKLEYATGQANDMAHGNVFLPKTVNITAGVYDDLKDCEVVCITAGLPQKEGQTRMDLAQDNAKLMKDIVENIMKTGFDGILLIASNPVDVMTHVAQKVSGLPKNRVIGSGTVLDSARFRHNLSNYFKTNPRHIHAKVIGEHGDSSLPLWSSAYLGPKPILDIVSENPDRFCFEDMEKAYEEARDAAYEIIKQKGSTYYGIGVALNAITQAILNNQDSVLSVSGYLEGQFGHNDMYIAIPCVVNKKGIREVLNLNLTQEEQERFDKSANEIKNMFASIKI